MSVEGHGWLKPDKGATQAALRRSGAVHLLQIEVAQFASLRRLVGVQRSDLLGMDVAERVAAALPDAQICGAGRNLVEARFTGDDVEAVAAAAAAVQRAFDVPLMVDGERHLLQVLIGSASSAAGDIDDVLLVEQAERALIAARGAERPVAAVVDDDRIGRELKQAVARDELFLQYQPKLHLRRQEIVSIEALIRWSHPRNGLVLPNDFIPAAERTGDIRPLTLWTIRQVIADQRTLTRNGYPLPVFINMAGALLSDAAFVDEVIAIIGDSGARLGIEITETSVIHDPEGAIRHLNRLAEIGVAITIDDYGAGLSSLAYLKQLPARELKIDKLFVTDLTSSHRDPLIVRSTIDLAHALDMEVVAEGVETPASLALLSVMGCDMVQGYLISRPLALEALLAFLREEQHLAVAVSTRSPLERLAAVRARG